MNWAGLEEGKGDFLLLHALFKFSLLKHLLENFKPNT